MSEQNISETGGIDISILAVVAEALEAFKK